MRQLRNTTPGRASWTLSLPAGRFCNSDVATQVRSRGVGDWSQVKEVQYVRGARHLDPFLDLIRHGMDIHHHCMESIPYYAKLAIGELNE